MSRSLTLRQNLNQIILLMFIKVMHAIGIVPVDAEVSGCRLQAGKTAYRLIGIAIALRIGVLRHTPDSLNRLIGSYQLLHHIHIRALLRHGYRNHFNPKVLGNRKVTVIARNRAKPLYLIQLTPGGTSHNTVGHGTGNGVIHNIQRRVSENEDMIRMIFHHIGKKLLRLCDTIQYTVISNIHTFAGIHIRIAVQSIHHVIAQIQLLSTGLSSTHIQIHIHGLVAPVLVL